MVGRGHCRAAVGIRARHGIVTSGIGMQGVGGRGKRGGVPLPHIGAGTRSRESSLYAATFGCRTRDGYRGGTIDGHCGRGSVGTAVGAARQCNRLGADRVDLDRICIRASGPSIARSTTRLEGHSGTVSRSGIGAAIDGNRRQGFHIHECGGRGRTAVGTSARHGVIARGGGVHRGCITQIVAPLVRGGSTRSSHINRLSGTRRIRVVVIATTIECDGGFWMSVGKIDSICKC